MRTLTKGTRKIPFGSNGAHADFVPVEALLTVEQWVELPDTKPRYELIDGRLVQKMATNTGHAWAAGEFLIACGQWGRTSGWRFLPEGTGVKIHERGGYVPDVVGFPPDFPLEPQANYNERPFLVVEVLSRKTAKRDRSKKKRDYARSGVQLYLIIDINARTVEVYRLQDGAMVRRKCFGKAMYGSPLNYRACALSWRGCGFEIHLPQRRRRRRKII